MIQISQIKIPIEEGEEYLTSYIASFLKVNPSRIQKVILQKRSIDARKKPRVYYVYTVICEIPGLEKAILRKFSGNRRICRYVPVTFRLPNHGGEPLTKRPVVIGLGPAGLFCSYLLAKSGYAPIVMERGKPASERIKDIELFWETGLLHPASNVQFGEGGAGTFSDGKLNTLVKDRNGRQRFVLKTLVQFGAPPAILSDAKPHIGTDILIHVVTNMRREIQRLGGEIHFQEQVIDLAAEGGRLVHVSTDKNNYETSLAVLAIGHSARDTFRMLHRQKVAMSAKDFAVGFRVEHPQQLINEIQYGSSAASRLPAAPYKLAASAFGRGIYSFCMCPGGYVVNAASDEGQTVVNGMSYSGRHSKNANSAIVVSVGGSDFNQSDPLGAMAYQIQLEKKAFALGNGSIPQQLLGDFKENRCSVSYGAFDSLTKGAHTFANLRECFSWEINQAFLQGMTDFGKKIPGFDRDDVILSGVESRTSSPIRIHRNDLLESSIRGLYPCGEGAGYAGGILSAATDGMKVAEEIIQKYQVQYEL